MIEVDKIQVIDGYTFQIQLSRYDLRGPSECAVHMVKAINNHDELLEAAKYALVLINDLASFVDDKHSPYAGLRATHLTSILKKIEGRK